ncbi:DUF924 family protein [Tardiphaga sp. P9-11]|jgi:uncharacterized protein (DUF924 family)|uniref:DUF924 family protein n=1 Tax=Tardiphaga sp. P9-11 TaxID=2024614 RepID=UPI0011F1700C|nr:DUF924 family protein [Tardiphaga sp. P9-11]KAA0078335.1 DUF924 domain-containing protein [Tardiphaga sp. P9-11]
MNDAASGTTPTDILNFWKDAGWDRWYAKNDDFDAEVTRRFRTLWDEAVAGGLASWEASDDGTLALILVLDQFPRNMFRNDPRAFSSDRLARDLSVRAVALGVDQRVEQQMRQFVYMPLMHSEDLADQEHCCALFRATGEADNLKFADEHADIIRRFGRFPHRNRVLGRSTTPEEQAFLDAGGFGG